MKVLVVNQTQVALEVSQGYVFAVTWHVTFQGAEYLSALVECCHPLGFFKHLLGELNHFSPQNPNTAVTTMTRTATAEIDTIKTNIRTTLLLAQWLLEYLWS